MEEEEKRLEITPPWWRLRGTKTVSLRLSPFAPQKFLRCVPMCRSNVTNRLKMNH